MDDLKFSIFAPKGTFFVMCSKCGCPSIQYCERPSNQCTWCDLNLEPIDDIEDADVDS